MKDSAAGAFAVISCCAYLIVYVAFWTETELNIKMGSLLVEKIDGDFFNVMGLPLLRLSRMLANFGVKLL